MDDNFFDDKLKRILESPPEYRPDMAAVSDMQNRLRAAQFISGKNMGWLALVPFLFLSVLFGGGFFYYKTKALNTEVIELRKQIAQFNVQKDTLINKHIVYQYDTIYKVTYIEKTIENKTPVYSNPISNNYLASSYLPKQIGRLNSLKNKFDWGPDKYGFPVPGRLPGLSFFEKNNSTDEKAVLEKNKEIGFVEVLPLGKLSHLNSFGPDLNSKLNKNHPVGNKKKINPLLYFRPTGFSIKGQYAPFLFMQNKHGGKGKTYNLTGAFELPKNRSLLIGLEFFNFNFKIEGNENLSGLPSPVPNNPGDVLSEIYTNFRYLQIPLGIRHDLLKNSRLHPAVSAGVVAVIPLSQKFKYEYKGNFTEYELEAGSKGGSFSMDNLRLGIGLDYSLWKNFSLGTEINYQHGFSKDEAAFSKIKYWAFHFGIKYKL